MAAIVNSALGELHIAESLPMLIPFQMRLLGRPSTIDLQVCQAMGKEVRRRFRDVQLVDGEYERVRQVQLDD